jgi:hypothetical protein
MYIDPAILTPLAVLLGAVTGGGASLWAAIYTQRNQNRLQRVASILLGGEEQRLIGLINRMRLFAPPNVVKSAEAVLRAIVEISLKPGVEIRRLANQALSDSLDPHELVSFSLICRADLDSVLRTAA